MNKEERIQLALEKHKNGYNCAQAVLCAYADMFGLDEATAYRLAEAFGRGNGDRKGICGAVSGALIVAGLKESQGPGAKSNKEDTYDMAAKITSKFEEMNGSLICHELKGKETGKPLRSCPGCIKDAAGIAGEMINGELTAGEIMAD